MRDLPDHTQQIVLRYEGGFIGLEELAVRVGSIVPWDFKGNIFLAEGFESEDTEVDSHAETAASTAARSSAHKYQGDWSFKLETGDVADEYTYLGLNLVQPTGSKIAVQSMLGFDSGVKEIIYTLDAWDGTNYYHAAIKYNRNDQKLYYLDSSSTYQEFASSVRLGKAAFMWVPFRLGFDPTTGYYTKAYVAGVEYDLSGYAMNSGSTVGNSLIVVGVANYALAGLGCTIHVDNIVGAANVQ